MRRRLRCLTHEGPQQEPTDPWGTEQRKAEAEAEAPRIKQEAAHAPNATEQAQQTRAQHLDSVPSASATSTNGATRTRQF